MLKKVRRLSVLVLALALIITGAVKGVQASDMAVKMSAASTGDMPMPGCGGCSGDDQGMPMACFTVCGSSVIAILPTVPAIVAVVLVSPSAPSLAFIAGRHGPPDPYPPRLAILG